VSGAGGSGGLYGGGGGGGGYAGSGFAPGGSGSQGLIVVTYTPTASAAVTAESWSALEAQETTRADQPGAIESGLIIVCNSWPLTEAGASTWHNDVIGIDFGHITAGDLSFPAEWAGAVAVTADASARLEAGARFSFDATVPLGAGSRALQDTVGFGEWSETHSNQGWMVAVEQLAAVRGDCRPQIECVGRLSSDAQTCVEWADPQGLLLVSSERLLSPPARIRILANTSSGHPLRGQ
jgi:hypothetical protein